MDIERGREGCRGGLRAFPLGEYVVARGPNRTAKESLPDVEGVVVFRDLYPDGSVRIMWIQEKGRKKPTPVNPGGGWVSIVSNGVVFAEAEALAFRSRLDEPFLNASFDTDEIRENNK